MKATLKTLILTTLALGMALAACDSPAKRQQQARTLYKEGVELREQRRSEEAAECFLQGIALMQGIAPTTENLQLEGDLKDNLGAMYNKHGLFDDALTMHREAIAAFKQVGDTVGLMTAYRNSGRVAKMLEQFAQAKQFYDTAFSIATSTGPNGAIHGRIFFVVSGAQHSASARPIFPQPMMMIFIEKTLVKQLSENIILPISSCDVKLFAVECEKKPPPFSGSGRNFSFPLKIRPSASQLLLQNSLRAS